VPRRLPPPCRWRDRSRNCPGDEDDLVLQRGRASHAGGSDADLVERLAPGGKPPGAVSVMTTSSSTMMKRPSRTKRGSGVKTMPGISTVSSATLSDGGS